MQLYRDEVPHTNKPFRSKNSGVVVTKDPLMIQVIECLREADLSETKLANKIGIAVNSIRHWRLGGAPNVYTLKAALEAVGYELTIRKINKDDATLNKCVEQPLDKPARPA